LESSFRGQDGIELNLREALVTAASHLGMLDSYALLRRKMSRPQVATLMYHHVCPREGEHPNFVSPEKFRAQMEYFSREWQVLSLDELAEYVLLGKSIPERAVAITLEDGYQDNYRYAYPILKEYRIPATVFLTTGYVGSRDIFWWNRIDYAIQHTSRSNLHLGKLGAYSVRSEAEKTLAASVITENLRKLPEAKRELLVEKVIDICEAEARSDLNNNHFLSWEECKEMKNNSIDIGSHTVSHPMLTRLPPKQARYEMEQSKKHIEEKLGMEVKAFSYPFGDYDTDMVALVRKSGYAYAVTATPRKAIGSEDNVYQIGRVAPRYALWALGRFNDTRSIRDLRLVGIGK